jgi:CheY-like chemotaxis protein
MRRPRSTTSVMSGGSSPIRILAVDDHQLVRDGIAGFLAVQPDMTLVAEAANGREAIQQFRTHRPDVTLMDLQMPEMNGLDALIAIRAELDHRAHDLRGRHAHPPRRQGRCSGLSAQEHTPFRFAANHPNGPCWQKESVAGGVVPDRSACQR